MFFVINKEKAFAYIVSIITVVILFCATNVLNKNTNGKNTVQQTSANVQMQNDNTCNNFQVTKNISENQNALKAENKNILNNSAN